MDSCDRRVRAYKNGKTMEECKAIAESLNPGFKKQIYKNNEKFFGLKYWNLLIMMN